MIVFPNCKINLGLRVLRKRSDGYHDLETVFYPLPLYDALELIATQDNQFSFSQTGLAVAGNTADNLCVKAWHLLKKDFPGLPGARLHLHKAIPAGAGLGGGSADAAFTLRLLNKRFGLELTQETLIRYALQLGSDCPFFIINQPCFATSRGEDLSPVQLNLQAYRFVLVNPGIMIPTGKAFGGIVPAVPGKTVADIIRQPVDTWRAELVNDFETTVFQQYPDIGAIKQQLYDRGAVYASLSGTGSTVYGLFPREADPGLSFPDTWLVRSLHSQLQ